jgi:5'(3')-deoxyribonucleotidase
MKRIFMDFDGVIVNSRKAYCDTYSQLYAGCEHYVHPNWRNVEEWDLSKLCPLSREDLFGHDLFFYDLEFMGGAKQHLESLSRKFDISICSIGTYDNITHKSNWIKHKLPFMTSAIFINPNHDYRAGKSVINMKDSIFIDDVSLNLDSSNAEIKICYGDVFSWNNDWEGTRCATWNELYKELMKYADES